MEVRTAECRPTAMRTAFNVAARTMAFTDARTAIRAWFEFLDQCFLLNTIASLFTRPSPVPADDPVILHRTVWTPRGVGTIASRDAALSGAPLHTTPSQPARWRSPMGDGIVVGNLIKSFESSHVPKIMQQRE
jgi:hypothetical protein